MGQFFEYEMTVDSRDVDGWGRCRPSAVLGYLQEAATLAAEDGGFGREKTCLLYTSSFFQPYLDLCEAETAGAFGAAELENSRIITSDDVFDGLRCV